jgi:PEGA domain-containing protein
MTKVANPTLYWAVLARPRGEVLTAEAESPGLHLGLLGVPPGFGTNSAEGWLYEVMGVAHEASPAPPGSQPIPSLLHHALTGLLFSHGELWSAAGGPRPCSFAFAHTVHEVGFGWVGDAQVKVVVDGEPCEPAWVMVRDDAGREAHAWSIPSNHSVQVAMVWSPGGTDAAVVEAVWSGVTNLESEPALSSTTPSSETEDHADAQPATATDNYSARLRALQAQLAIDDDEIESVEVITDYPDEIEPTEERKPPGGSAIARWLRRGFSWFSVKKEPVVGEATLEEEQPQPEEPNDDVDGGRGEIVGPATASASEARKPAPVPLPAPPPSAALPPPAPASSPGVTSVAPATVPEFIPPTPEPATVTRTAAPSPPPAVAIPTPATNIWRRVPERIPPTPELAELTGRATAWSAPPDPHIRELPAPRSATAAPREAARAEVVKAPTPKPTRAVPPPVSQEAVVRPAFQRFESVAADPRDPAIVQSGPASTTAERAPHARRARARSFTVPQQRPTWPSAQQLSRPATPMWRRPWAWLLVAVVLVLGGWLVGAIQDAGHSRDASGRGALSQALRSIGLGGPRFSVNVNSRPPGAWIAVDGKTLALRTPAAVEVTPGEHTIGLSFPDLGGADYTVRGLKGDRVPLDATLWGTLEIFSPGRAGVLSVDVDGVTRGFAPLRIDSLTPGVHELRFSGLGMTPWGQTVDIRVGETKEVLARATTSPATGVLQVNASLTDEQGTQPLKGGQVWIDGEPRGVAPLTLDLPRGPHSVRLVYKGQEAPIQVIDLPGGNQRFAVFEFGLDLEPAQLIADVPPRIARDRPTVVSASLSGAGEVREMWLHTQTAEGPWKRYPMTLMKTTGTIVGVTVFPANTLDAQGRARYYLSAQNQQGDESFTEIHTIQAEKPPAH